MLTAYFIAGVQTALIVAAVIVAIYAVVAALGITEVLVAEWLRDWWRRRKGRS